MSSNLLCLRALALAVTDAQAPVKETPRWSNRAPRIDTYLRTADEPLGQPYCCSAVYTWYDEAARGAGVRNPLRQTGYCPYLAEYFLAHGLARPRATDAKPGDVILFWIAPEGRYAHAGLVLENLGNGTVRTVEANTLATGVSVEGPHQNDGDGVYIKTRQLRDPGGHPHLVGDLQHVLVASAPEKTDAPKHLAVRVDGVVYPDVPSLLSPQGTLLVGARAFLTVALHGRAVRSSEVSPDGQFFDVVTTEAPHA